MWLAVFLSCGLLLAMSSMAAKRHDGNRGLLLTSNLEGEAEEKQRREESDCDKKSLRSDSRSTYIRWGRNDCPSTASLVYEGEVGGSWYNDAGSAANRLCLSKNPTFDSEKSNKGLSKIMGAVYEGIGFSEHSNIYCAVCLTTKSTTIMVPGTNECPTGWTRQYWGHLTAGYYRDQGASEYLCLDSTPHGIKRPGHLGPKFFYTLTECAGNLPCPPYRDGRVVMCAVCSI